VEPQEPAPRADSASAVAARRRGKPTSPSVVWVPGPQQPGKNASSILWRVRYQRLGFGSTEFRHNAQPV